MRRANSLLALAAVIVAALASPAFPSDGPSARALLHTVAKKQEKPPVPASPLAKARQQARAAQSAAAAARNAANAAAFRADRERAALQEAMIAAENARASKSSGSTTRMLAETQASQDVASARAAVTRAQQALDDAQRQVGRAAVPLPPNSPATQQQTNLIAQAQVTAAQMRLTMAQQQLAMAQSRAAQQAVDAGLDSNKAVTDAVAANDALRARRLSYQQLVDAARIADAKARAYEQAAAEAWRKVERLRKKAKPSRSTSR